MDDRRQTLVEDLTGLIRGEVRADAIAAATYASDSSLYEIAPLAVACPRDREDVVALAKYAQETSTPLIARGAGTGIAGQAIGRGIVVDFSRHMRAIGEVGSDTVRVQPGVTRDRLNALLAEHGRHFAPDPSNTRITTVGGMLGVDAAGSRAVHVGSTRDHVRSLDVVLAGGAVLEAERIPLADVRPVATSAGFVPILDEPGYDDTMREWILGRLAHVLTANEPLIRERQPLLLRNASGYMLRGVAAEGHLNLPRMLVGSEGTLGLFTSAELFTLPLPPQRGVVLLLFGRLEAATRAVQRIAALEPSACDLFDRRLLTLAREANPRFARLISPNAEAALLVEQTAGDAREVRERMRQVVAASRETESVAVAAEGYAPSEVEFLWSLPATVVPMLTRLRGNTRPVPIVEDVAVPPERLHEFLVLAQNVLQQHEVTATLYAHAASGQVHLRPFLSALRPTDGVRLEALARRLYEVVFEVGGTISGEHGDGLSRTAFVREQYGPLYDVFRQIKDVFDPHNVLNPGKIVGEDVHLTSRNLRATGAVDPNLVELQLQWSPEDAAAEAERCNGCGVCRVQSPRFRMCPFFQADPSEERSPRSKANLLRNYVAGTLDPRQFGSEDARRLADTCFNCKQCHLECPSNVNVAWMAIEAKAAHVAVNGLGWTDWLLSRSHSIGSIGWASRTFVNAFTQTAWGRWCLERVFGIARQRRLPRFARRSFLASLDRRYTTSPDRDGDTKPIVYFVDTFANHHDVELARAFVAVLEHNGIAVHVPPDQTASGMAMICCGDLTGARKLAERNVRVLADFAREGYQVVCTEPTAALCLSQEYPMLTDHADVHDVANAVIDAGTLLGQLHAEGRLKTDFRPLPAAAAYHTPCHVRALGEATPLADLVSLIPGTGVRMLETGCSGMAGTFGLKRKNLRTSLRMGWRLITALRHESVELGLTECSSCRMQMERVATPTVHPLKLLAAAYGLMPELETRLFGHRQPSERPETAPA